MLFIDYITNMDHGVVDIPFPHVNAPATMRSAFIKPIELKQQVMYIKQQSREH